MPDSYLRIDPNSIQIINSTTGETFNSNYIQEGETILRQQPSQTITVMNDEGITFQIPDNKTINYIRNFNYIPNQFHFHRVDNEEELYMGVELEIDGSNANNNDVAKRCIDMLGENNIYCKSDGSLQSGFEIVTHPCTYQYHKQLSYQNLFDFLAKEGYKSHNTSTCGLHVHFNKDYFGKDKLHQDLNIGKLLYILEKFWEKVVLIARRDSNRYSRRFTIKEDETILDMYAKSKNSDKYGAVNLQHKNSFEIRIFKGTLNYETFLNTLEFVNKIVRYIKSVDIYDIQMITWDDISLNFSQRLLDYIDDRSEKEKNKPKPKTTIENIISGRGRRSFVTCDDYQAHVTPCMNYGSHIQSGWTELNEQLANLSSVFDSFNAQINVDENATMVNEQTIRRRIQDLRQRERRERNPMAQTNMRREINELERQSSIARRECGRSRYTSCHDAL